MPVLKALTIETKTFSALFGLTALQDGNPPFHLQMLPEDGMSYYNLIIKKIYGADDSALKLLTICRSRGRS